MPIARIAVPLALMLLAGCSASGGSAGDPASSAAPAMAPPLPTALVAPQPLPPPQAAAMTAAAMTAAAMTAPAMTAPPPAQPASASGRPGDRVYSGEAKLLAHQHASCPVSMQLHGMRVQGQHVRMGDLQGTTKPDGSLSMKQGQIMLTGHFHGPIFVGRYAGPRCAYQVSLKQGAE